MQFSFFYFLLSFFLYFGPVGGGVGGGGGDVLTAGRQTRCIMGNLQIGNNLSCKEKRAKSV